MKKNIAFACALCVIITLVASPAWAAEGGGLPQFDPSSWASQIFWLTIFFVVLYWVFGKSVLPTMAKTIETRTNFIADQIASAEKLSSEAEALRHEVDTAMKDAAQRANLQVVEATQSSKETLNASLTAFRTRFEKTVAETENRITTAKLNAMNDMEQIAATLAAQAAEKIAGIPAAQSGAESVVKSLSQKQKQAA